MGEQIDPAVGEARMLLAAGRSEQAEETLRGAIAAAHERADESAALRGRVELGDLLAATGRESEASALLREVLASPVDGDELAADRARASAIVARLAGVEPVTETGRGGGGAGSW